MRYMYVIWDFCVLTLFLLITASLYIEVRSDLFTFMFVLSLVVMQTTIMIMRFLDDI